jgi:hypothetical protein
MGARSTGWQRAARLKRSRAVKLVLAGAGGWAVEFINRIGTQHNRLPGLGSFAFFGNGSAFFG